MNWIEVNGTSLRCELSGNGKTTLVLVHEMGGTLDSWDQVLPTLNNARQVLRYDTRGAGLSEKIHGRVTFDDMAADLAALLDAPPRPKRKACARWWMRAPPTPIRPRFAITPRSFANSAPAGWPTIRRVLPRSTAC